MCFSRITPLLYNFDMPKVLRGQHKKMFQNDYVYFVLKMVIFKAVGAHS